MPRASFILLSTQTHLNSTLEEMFADVCVDSGLNESAVDKGVDWKILAQRIGTTNLESGIIAAHQQRLTDAKTGVMVSVLRVDAMFLLTFCSKL